MKIEKDKWVEIHYTLKDDSGQQLEIKGRVKKLPFFHTPTCYYGEKASSPL